jgi:hypothetical protein
MSRDGMKLLHRLYEESHILQVSFNEWISVRLEAETGLINKIENENGVEVLEYGAG